MATTPPEIPTPVPEPVPAPAPTPVPREERIKTTANALAESADADIFFYNSEIYRPCDYKIIRECAKRRRRNNIILILVTEGGDPDAAYRIARCFQKRYKRFICIVPGCCKSSGTLIATGANELVMFDNGELGPLDVQIPKKDELWEMQSGLTVMSALQALHEKAFSALEHFFLTIKRKSRNTVTLKTATELAAKLTAGLFSPIFQQIDPIHVGEAYRATAIAWHYGIRLASYGENISEESLSILIGSYPAHGFVIDREEADALFDETREPNREERHLIKQLGVVASAPAGKDDEIRRFLSDEEGEQNVTESDSQEDSASGGPSSTPNAPPGEGIEGRDIPGGSAAAA
jgi:hypothetical protein